MLCHQCQMKYNTSVCARGGFGVENILLLGKGEREGGLETFEIGDCFLPCLDV